MILAAAGLKVLLEGTRHASNVAGWAQAHRKDALWLAKLTKGGRLRRSFELPPENRRREFARLRAPLNRERTRLWAQLGRLLERALINISDAIFTPEIKSCRAITEALDGKLEEHREDDGRILWKDIPAA